MIEAPALNDVGVEQRAGVLSARRDHRYACCQAGDIGRRADGRVRRLAAVADLSLGVVAPALGRTARGHHTGVNVLRVDGGQRDRAETKHGGGRHDSLRGRGVAHGADADLAFGVIAPAQESSRHRDTDWNDGAGMGAAEG